MTELRVVRHTTHFAAACDFYGGVLGWPVTRQWDEPRSGRIFGYGDAARVELIDSEHEDAVTGLYLSIEVEHVDLLHEAMGAHDVEITQPLANQPWGHRNFGVSDPTGLPLVFFEVIA
ncbi:MAG TPA: VOC family protein [Ilumatobacteraceae bacterium]